MLHLAFDAMVGIGFALLALGAWLGFAWWRKRDIPATKWFLRAVALSGIGAVVAMEAGWVVTEVGRQPWIVYEVMRTEDAVTEAGGLWFCVRRRDRPLRRRSGRWRPSRCGGSPGARSRAPTSPSGGPYGRRRRRTGPKRGGGG